MPADRSDSYLDLAIFAAALIGGVIGFLWFNAFPAEVFMGDTGSMALGGAIAAFAIMTKTEVLLVFIGGIYLIEALSVIIQVVSLQAHREARVPDGADPPPLRDEGVVRDQDHGALLDRRRDPLRDRLRPLLPLLPPLQAVTLRRVLVVGLARSGEAAALALRAQGTEVVGYDRNAALDAAVLGRLTARGVEIHLGEEDETLLRGVDAVVKSPGVPGEMPLVAGARAHDLPVWSEIELGARLLANPIVGVTGTNGKTTTTALLGEIFRAGERPVEVAGNIGRPLTSLVGQVDGDAWVVCELSSFQLEDVESLRPRIAVLLNLEPDHLDRHGHFDGYRDAKLRIFERQTEDDVAVVPRGFGPVPGAARRIEFSADDALPGELRLPGAHNRENAAAATAAARAAGIADDAIARALASFPGVEHRIEEVEVVRGVRYVNDSKATNVAAALRAVASFDAPLHLILGGLGKHESYEPLAAALDAADRAYLIGAATDEIAAALDAAGIGYVRAGDLTSAVAAAALAARPGDVVLLSPACASFDQFESFEQRGEVFRALVTGLEHAG